MSINTKQLENILQNFVSSTSGIEGVALITPDGLPLASNLPNTMDEERVAAMSAAMLSLGERIGSELTRGSIQRIFVEGDLGYGILTSCGEDAVFLVLANSSTKQGLLMLAIKQATNSLRKVLVAVEEESSEPSYVSLEQERNLRSSLRI